MTPEIYWSHAGLKAKITMMPRQRENDWVEDEIISYKNCGVSIVVNIDKQSGD